MKRRENASKFKTCPKISGTATPYPTDKLQILCSTGLHACHPLSMKTRLRPLAALRIGRESNAEELRQVRPAGVDGAASALQSSVVRLDDDLPMLPQEAIVVVELRVLNVLPIDEPSPLGHQTAAKSGVKGPSRLHPFVVFLPL